MFECIFKQCKRDSIGTYYFATYKRAFVELKYPITEPMQYITRLFYEKDIYCARIYDATYKKYTYNCDDFYNMYITGKLRLYNGESIQKLSDTTVVVLDKYPCLANTIDEMNAYTYIERYTLAHEWKGNSSVMWSKWCEYCNTDNQV